MAPTPHVLLAAVATAIFFSTTGATADPVVDFVLRNLPNYERQFVDELDEETRLPDPTTHASHDPANPFDLVIGLNGGTERSFRMGISYRLHRRALADAKNRFSLSGTELRNLSHVIAPVVQSAARRQLQADGSQRHEAATDACDDEREHDDCRRQRWWRTMDGSCNNLHHPTSGRAFSALRRLLPADYGDGVDEPRSRADGGPLPSARAISNVLFRETKTYDAYRTEMTTTFGQLLSHDVARTAISKRAAADGKLRNVRCGADGCATDGAHNVECMPIAVDSENDDNLADFVDCLKFVRSQATTSSDCSGERQQVNQITAFVDASFIYGSSDDELRELREPGGYLLKVSRPSRRTSREWALLPRMAECPSSLHRGTCFRAGDTRVNEFVGLTCLHTVFMRYHNYIAGRLARLPRARKLSAERIFQEARRLVVAVWQHVVYNEYLPVVLGPVHMARYRLFSATSGYRDVYRSRSRPGTFNVVATAAFRFGHSQVGATFAMYNRVADDVEPTATVMMLQRPYHVLNATRTHGPTVDAMMRGHCHSSAADADGAFSDAVRQSLFSPDPPRLPGTDLPAINVQRGRDHGLPGYLKWRKYCHLSENLKDIPRSRRAALRAVYRRKLQDVDLYVGAMLERNVPGGAVGPTFACLLAEQFHALKTGDRFWYERGDPDVAFTPRQLRQIRRTSLAKILCRTVRSVAAIQPRALLRPAGSRLRVDRKYDWRDVLATGRRVHGWTDNRMTDCRRLTDVDIRRWLA